VITVQQLNDVLLMPNAALRFTPPASKSKRRSGGGIFGAMFRRPRSDRRQPDNQAAGQKVYVLKQDQPQAVVVKTGASDGKFTELRSGDLKAGDQVIIDAVNIKS
jgi:HlyD family secretion protein